MLLSSKNLFLPINHPITMPQVIAWAQIENNKKLWPRPLSHLFWQWTQIYKILSKVIIDILFSSPLSIVDNKNLLNLPVLPVIKNYLKIIEHTIFLIILTKTNSFQFANMKLKIKNHTLIISSRKSLNILKTKTQYFLRSKHNKLNKIYYQS